MCLLTLKGKFNNEVLNEEKLVSPPSQAFPGF